MPNDKSLSMRHWQLFCKRLRKKVGRFRYFAAGEYDEKLRPHYHAIMFGLDFRSDRYFFKRSNAKGNPGLYRSPLLEDTWAFGYSSVGEMSFQSAAYIARYTLKKARKLTQEERDTRYERIDPRTGECWKVRPEFVTMSRGGRGGKGGIGKSWFEKFKSDVFPADHVVHQDRKFKVPRFYSDMLDEDELLELKARRQIKAETRRDELAPERMEAREAIHESRVKQLRRV